MTSYLGLAEGQSARLPHGEQTFRAVLTHAGQNDARRLRASCEGDRVEKHVD